MQWWIRSWVRCSGCLSLTCFPEILSREVSCFCHLLACRNTLILEAQSIMVSFHTWLLYRHHPLIPVYLWLYRFYLKEFRGSRRWLIFLEGEYFKTQLDNLVPKGQLVLAWCPHWNFDGDVILSHHLLSPSLVAACHLDRLGMGEFRWIGPQLDLCVYPGSIADMCITFPKHKYFGLCFTRFLSVLFRIVE